MSIRAAIESIIRDAMVTALHLCTVEAVDAATLTCDAKPLTGGPVFYKVKLRASEDGKDKGLVLLPKIGSVVVIGLLSKGGNAVLLASTDITAAAIRTEAGFVEITETDIVHLNGDSHKAVLGDQLNTNLGSIIDQLTQVTISISLIASTISGMFPPLVSVPGQMAGIGVTLNGIKTALEGQLSNKVKLS